MEHRRIRLAAEPIWEYFQFHVLWYVAIYTEDMRVVRDRICPHIPSDLNRRIFPMRLEDALRQDFSKMTPQQRSHLRRRILAAGLPVPPELDLKKGQSVIPADNPKPDNKPDGPWKAIVVSGGVEHAYTIGAGDET